MPVLYIRENATPGAAFIPVPEIEGKKGDTGVGISSIERTSGTGAAGTTDTYTITFSDSTTTTFTVLNGANGADGADGADGTNGTNGTNGANGTDGQSAYAAAQAGGYTGTQSDFYADLAAIEGLAAVLAAI